MGMTKFDGTWWTRGHGTLSAHGEGGLIGAHAPPIKNHLLLQSNFNPQSQL
jgi:hypothetical protein